MLRKNASRNDDPASPAKVAIVTTFRLSLFAIARSSSASTAADTPIANRDTVLPKVALKLVMAVLNLPVSTAAPSVTITTTVGTVFERQPLAAVSTLTRTVLRPQCAPEAPLNIVGVINPKAACT
jgi:hypothetical protein